MNDSYKIIIIIIVVVLAVGSIERATDYADLSVKPKKTIVELSAREAKLAGFFVEHGSSQPIELARTVAKMKRPKLAAAQAVIESNGRPEAIGKAPYHEKGIWQVIEAEHGITPPDIQGQARQYEQIMEQMIKESDGNLNKALSLYNGDKSGRYSAKVRLKIQEMAQL